MTDEEVRQWLSPAERDDFRYARRIKEKEDYEPHYLAIVSLAETRKALHAFRPRTMNHPCGACGHTGGHVPDCIFATMPRPR